MSLNQTLDQVRAARGLPALPDPTRIQGFGEPGDAPSPHHLPAVIEVQDPNLPMDDDEFGIDAAPPAAAPPLPSALVPGRRRQPLPDDPLEVAGGAMGGTLAQQLTLQKALEHAAATLPHARLALIDKLGEWKGRKVVLNDDEYRQVLAVIFAAQRRELDADSAEVLGAEPRRRRRRTVVVKPEAAKVLPTVEKPAGETVTVRRTRRARGSLLGKRV